VRWSNRRIGIAFALSLAVHLAVLLALPRPEYKALKLASRAGPLTVELVPAERPQPEVSPVPMPQPVRPPPQSRPNVKPLVTARPNTPHAAPPVPTPPPEPTRPEPQPTPPAPQVDMLAMIQARRSQRKAAEAAAARGSVGIPGSQNNPEDEGAAALAENLKSLNNDDQTGGVFEILNKGTRSAEYAFNGWRPDTHRRWREVIEVDAPTGVDIEHAIVRSMIALIRTHYTGDFLWESHRLQKVVRLSARLEDNGELEEFLIREFFGTPVLGPNAARRY
jgi:type IV secretory pathway VirB10-like protein